MCGYTIFTDMGCDIPLETLDGWQVKCIDLHFAFSDDQVEHTNRDMNTEAFYKEMRSGRTGKTSGANLETYLNAFREELQAGRDILYVGFTSGLSGSVLVAQNAAKALQEEYPQHQVIAVDTLCGSVGLSWLLKMVVAARDKDATLSELVELINATAPRICHWFTVDDLMHLKRGGRLKPTAAIIGTVLQIKPVLHMDEEGHLVAVSKVRGRKAAIRALVEKYKETAEHPEDGFYAISHSDCLEDALALQNQMLALTGKPADLLESIGPVIGIHCGPGTLALYFFSKNR